MMPDEINNIKINMERMQTDIEYIKEAVGEIKTNLCKKADKKDVDILKCQVEKLKKFKWQLIAIGAVILFLLQVAIDKLL